MDIRIIICKKCGRPMRPFLHETINMFSSVHYKCGKCNREITYQSCASLIVFLLISGVLGVGWIATPGWLPVDKLWKMIAGIAMIAGAWLFFLANVFELIRRIRRQATR